MNDVQGIIGCSHCGASLLTRTAHRCKGCMNYFCFPCFETHLRANWNVLSAYYRKAKGNVLG